MGQPVVHFEFWSPNPQRVADFYGTAFGWQVKHLPEMNYWLTNSGSKAGINGGIMQPQPGPWPGNVCLYISVPRLEDALAQVRAAGGKIVVERMEVPNMGAFALFEDPDGRVNGVWEELAKPTPTRRARPQRLKKKTARRPRVRRRRR